MTVAAAAGGLPSCTTAGALDGGFAAAETFAFLDERRRARARLTATYKHVAINYNAR